MLDEQVTIRNADVNDLDRLTELSEEWAREGITFGQSADDREWFERSLGSYLLVADVQGDIIGFAQAEEQVSGEQHTAVMPTGTRFLNITNAYVVPQWRSHGIGGALLDEMLARAENRGIHRSMVYSAASDLDRILAFYRSHGFQGWFVQLYK